MDWNVRQEISVKIMKAVEKNDSAAIVAALVEGTKICLENVEQAINGCCTNFTLPCVLAALMIVEKTIIKTHARPEDVKLAETLAADCNVEYSVITFPIAGSTGNDE